MNYLNSKIAVVGLGYVGLPLAIALANCRDVVGFDVDSNRVKQLQSGEDRTCEIEKPDLEKASRLKLTDNSEKLTECDIFIVAVPTPVNKNKQPDMDYVRDACRLIGSILKPGTIVIFECTVYPGATEEICVPILAERSGLTYNEGFFCGYSPERINPGDKNRSIADIVKVTSGSTPAIAKVVDGLYAEFVTAGTHLVSSIAVAEAAKVIENTQRDVNIALVNELALIFNRLHINTLEVLEAAGTKWNFVDYRPGLVGGHCIGVDPYYLTHKAQEVGYHPEIILAGRRLNDHMPIHVADQIVKLMLRKSIPILDSNILVLGLSFKENCPDLRNTKVIDLIQELESYHANVDVYDPWINPDEAEQMYNIKCLHTEPQIETYDAIILAVKHSNFVEVGFDTLRSYGKWNAIFYDMKTAFSNEPIDGSL